MGMPISLREGVLRARGAGRAHRPRLECESPGLHWTEGGGIDQHHGVGL